MKLIPISFSAVLALFTATAVASERLPDAAALELAAQFSRHDHYAAAFHQVVKDVDGVAIDEYRGRVAISRPSKLRWDVDTPLEQSIVLEQNYMQQYDRDLDQLTLRDLEPDSLALPKVLLQGDAESISRSFRVSSEGFAEQGNDNRSYRLEPLQEDAQFVSLSVCFVTEGLVGLTIVDELQQVTTIEFSTIDTAALPAGYFELDVSDDTDVVGP